MEQRPIKARSTRWARAAARAVAGAGLTPNAVSVLGVAAAAGAAGCLAATRAADGGWQRLLWFAGAVLVQLRLLGNMLDGMVAQETGGRSRVGEIYNEVPDRIADALVLVALGYAAGGSPALGYLAACLAIFVAYVRAQAALSGAPMDYRGPMAKPHRMAVVTAAALYLAAAPEAWRPRWGPGGRWGPAAAALVVILLGSAWTAARRLLRAGRALREGP